MYRKEFSISEFTWDNSAGFVVILAAWAYVFYRALAAVYAFYLWFKIAKNSNLLPVAVKKLAIYELLFWLAFSLGSSWCLLNVSKDFFLSYSNVSFSVQGVSLRYFGPMPNRLILWSDIKRSRIIESGRTTGILEIETTEGALLDSSRGDLGTLSDIVHEIESHRRRQ